MNITGYGAGVITEVVGATAIRYRVRIPDGHGNHRSLGTYATRELAEQVRAASPINSAPFVGVSVADYGEHYIENCGNRDKRNMLYRWKRVRREAPFATRPIKQIRKADIKEWASSLLATRTVAWQTATHLLNLVRRVLGEAVEEGVIATNPAQGVRLPRREQRTETWTHLTSSEIVALLSCSKLTQEQRTVFTVAVYQGVRQGELAALRWAHMDLESDKPSMLIAGSWKAATKNGKPRRIPILEPTIAALKSWKARAKTNAELVFPSPHGGVYAKGYDWGWVNRVSKMGGKLEGAKYAAGITRSVRFHDLRHTCASHLVMGTWGRSWRLDEVREYLGHSTVQVTERYAHLAPDALHKTAAATARLQAQPDSNLTEGGEIPRGDLGVNYAESNEAGRTGLEPATSGVTGRDFLRDIIKLPITRSAHGQVHELAMARGLLQAVAVGGDPQLVMALARLIVTARALA